VADKEKFSSMKVSQETIFSKVETKYSAGEIDDLRQMWNAKKDQEEKVVQTLFPEPALKRLAYMNLYFRDGAVFFPTFAIMSCYKNCP